MRILITGHRGFIGQNMMKFMGRKHEVVGYEWGDGEVCLDGIDRVIHLGAISDTRCKDWLALMRQNVDFSADLMARCVDLGVPIQIASSASVYGPDNETFRETDEPDPRNLYAKSKLLVEQICAGQPGVQLFRYFNVYGPHEDHKGDQASPQHKFRQQAKSGQIRVFEGSDRYARDFIAVQQICAYHEAFFGVGESGVWNLGSGRATSFLTIAQEIAKSTGAEIIQIEMPEDLKLGYQPFTKADMSKTRQSINQRVSMDHERGIGGDPFVCT